MGETRRTVAIAFDDFQLLDIAGTTEAFAAASRFGITPGYETLVATADGGRVRSSSGLNIGADLAVGEVLDKLGAFDTLLIPGGAGSARAAQNADLIEAIAAVAEVARRVVAVCSGTRIAASAGLLDGYRATTHWGSTDQFAADYPSVEVIRDRVFVRDRNRWTSAGVAASVDLALALVEEDHGPRVAHRVATQLLIFARRGGDQGQFSAQLRAERAQSPSIRDLQLWLPDNLSEDLTIDSLASRIGMSPRNFARAFRKETGVTPAAHIEQLRVEAARRLLESTDLTLQGVAVAAGFKHAATLHRAFVRHFATSPRTLARIAVTDPPIVHERADHERHATEPTSTHASRAQRKHRPRSGVA